MKLAGWKRKWHAVTMIGALAVTTALTGCNNDTANTVVEKEGSATAQSTASSGASSEAPLEDMEYSFFDAVHSTPQDFYNNPNDVVTPYIENKFKIKVSDIVTASGMRPEEKFNLLVASDTLPDVVLVDNPNVSKFYASDKFVALDDYIDQLPNMKKWTSELAWNMLKDKDGHIIALPNATPFKSDPQVGANIPDDDIFYKGQTSMGLVVREDILQKLGYKFKTMSEIETDLKANPRNYTADELALDPKIETVADFTKLLQQIKDLNLMEGDKPVIPLSMMNWSIYHFSTLYTNPGWMIDGSGNVSGFLDNPGMRDYYKTINQWYAGKLLDNDYVIQKTEQYMEKLNSGRIAVASYSDNWSKSRESLKQINPAYDLRPIPWPKAASGKTYVDATYPSGFYNVMISKKVKDLPRLLKYFDWLYSDEAMELMTWGPESAGLYTEKDGKRVFKDESFGQAVASGQKTADGKSASYYGLYDPFYSDGFTAKALRTAVGLFGYNPVTWQKSYPVQMDAFETARHAVAVEKLATDGTHVAPYGENASEVGNWFWGEFVAQKVAKILKAKDDAEVDQAFDSVLKEFKADKYEAAKKDMSDYFRVLQGK
ncbi:hypothetical protein [Cohnella sp. GCM10012308]|uniref:hypothetical protein n=1 Tax=Cohnella sp. GCM10012308 TaxID=3317329 RepID=UPI0036184634